MTDSGDEQLEQWCVVLSAILLKDAPAEVAKHFDDAIAGSRKNTKRLQAIARDLGNWVQSAPKELQIRANQELWSRFGKSLDVVHDAEMNALRGVVARGRIESEDEYELVAKRVDEIYAMESSRGELESLNALLREHDKATAK